MPTSGLLSVYDDESGKFNTITIKQIAKSMSVEVDSFSILKMHYCNDEKAQSVFRHGSLSHFDRESVHASPIKDEAIKSDEINDLIALTNSFGEGYTNYVYYKGHWFNSPLDVKNIYYGEGYPENYHYVLSVLGADVHIYPYYVSAKNRDSDFVANTNVSKVVVFYPNNGKPIVICMSRHDIVAISATNQMESIYKNLVKVDPVLVGAEWYDFDPKPSLSFMSYSIKPVAFNDSGSPSWDSNVSLRRIGKNHNLDLEVLSSLLTSDEI